mmetsp:Transcript_5451/g.16054  ORF Transcript_5451/g.16054 Transcript_5451/m.16054 type:complete len:460 (-) Transcript_5451:447-1826(-)
MPRAGQVTLDPAALAEVQGWILALTGTDVEQQGGFEDGLKDGKTLCALANCLQPGVITKVHDSKLAFKQMENITKFAQACRKFGVPEEDMFETPDLYEGKAIGAVVRTLLSLGRVARSLASFSGPYIGATLATENVRTFRKEQLLEAAGETPAWTGGLQLKFQRQTPVLSTAAAEDRSTSPPAGSTSRGGRAAALPPPPKPQPPKTAPPKRAQTPEEIQAQILAVQAAVVAEINSLRAGPAAYFASKSTCLDLLEALRELPKEPVGLEPWKAHDALHIVAQATANDARYSAGMGTSGKQNRSLQERLDEQGSWQDAADEAIVFGTAEADSLVEALCRFKGLSELVLSEEFHVCGVGCGPHPTLGYACALVVAGDFNLSQASPPATRRIVICDGRLSRLGLRCRVPPKLLIRVTGGGPGRRQGAQRKIYGGPRRSAGPSIQGRNPGQRQARQSSPPVLQA